MYLYNNMYLDLLELLPYNPDIQTETDINSVEENSRELIWWTKLLNK